MFTGIVTDQGRLSGIQMDPGSSLATLTLLAPELVHDLDFGGSLSVDGVCLTLTGAEEVREGDGKPARELTMDVMGETLEHTTLGSLKPGHVFNLERCTQVGARLDGHLVQGHVDTTVDLLTRKTRGEWQVLRFALPPEHAFSVVKKGSIAINGVSLTISDVSPIADRAQAQWFEVSLIPMTLSKTNLGALVPGESVNVEFDVLAKYAQRRAEWDERADRTDQGAQSSSSELTGAQPATENTLELEDTPESKDLPESKNTPESDGILETDSLQDVIAAIKAGRAVVVFDHESRENEGDIIFAAQHASPELVAFTVNHTSGVLCAPMSAERALALALPPMVPDNQDPKGTNYTVSTDARSGISTGISASDRARTLRVLADPRTQAEDLTRPGHVFPLIAHPGGLAARQGHTEAAVALMQLAGQEPVAVIAEVVNPDGSMSTAHALRAFAREHDLPYLSVAQIEGLASTRREPASVLKTSEVATLPTDSGTFTAQAFQDTRTGEEHLVLSRLHPGSSPALVRIHSECLTGDVFGSAKCDCGVQLHESLAMIAEEGGHLIYLRGQEGRGIGLFDKIRAYALQERGEDTVSANRALGHEDDERDFSVAADILTHLGEDAVRLVTNNLDKVAALQKAGITVERISVPSVPTAENERYLHTKKERLGQLITIASPGTAGPHRPAHQPEHHMRTLEEQ